MIYYYLFSSFEGKGVGNRKALPLLFFLFDGAGGSFIFVLYNSQSYFLLFKPDETESGICIKNFFFPLSFCSLSYQELTEE